MGDNLLDINNQKSWDDLRTVQAWKDVNKTPWTEGLLDDNQTITGQEFSDNTIIGGMQKFNKGLLANTLGTAEQGFNYGMSLLHTPFAFAGDTAEGIHEALPDSWANKLSDIMYRSGSSMDSDDFGDHVEGHLLEGLLAFPTFAEFRIPIMKSIKNREPLPNKVKKEILEKANSNSSIRYTMDDVEEMFDSINISDKNQSGIIYEYDWYTKSKSWEGDKGHLWHGLKVNAKEQSKFEAKIKKKIIEREIKISEGETWAEQSKIKARLDDFDLKDLNKVRIEQGLTPIKETVTTKLDGKPIEAKFISGKISGKNIGLENNEIKRLAYILSDSIKSQHRRFQEDPLVMGLVDEYPATTLAVREKIHKLKKEIKKDKEIGEVNLDKLDELNTLEEKALNQNKKVLAMRQENFFLQPPYSYSEMETLSHEVGHLLHMHLTKNTIPSFLEGHSLEIGIANAELIAVSKSMRPNLWNDKHLKRYKDKIPDTVKEQHQKQVTYRMKDVELLADFIKGYLVEPLLTKRLAPNMSKILRGMVNESWFKDILKLAKADIMPKDGMLQKKEINSGLLSTATV